ncbi:hypothetical protein HPB49_023484 [Dermacentor silvarum]|uniref:Uncharacterized protein n=1 Tax=Dermacentor silvarum TaxID=543639 RepID=A0ACB8DRT2_DERSI|nr:hypothetical protein HPB49_023484 [Dermacentor silvarum]
MQSSARSKMSGYLPATVEPALAGVRLMRGIDGDKDQSFFLAQVKQEALQRSLFPLGDFDKTTVKQVATSIGLQRIATKKESMGLCFIGKRDFRAFVEQYLEPRPGSFVDMETGDVVGTHTGAGHDQLSRFCGIIGLPKPLHHKTFHGMAKKLHGAAMEAVSQNLEQARRATKDTVGGGDVPVMCDGTWQKRGHVSHNGVGPAVSLDTGLCLDFEVLSNYCLACHKDIGDDEEICEAFRHPVCEKNTVHSMQWKQKQQCAYGRGHCHTRPHCASQI